MLDLELPPSQENILKTLCDDDINRRDNVAYFVKMLNSLSRPISIAVDSPWGSGKTFFVKQVKLVLDAYNTNVELGNNVRESVKETMASYFAETEIKPFYSVYYDAWLNDNDIDPIQSLLFSITGAYQHFNKSFIHDKKHLIVLGKNIINLCSGSSLGNFLELLESDNVLNDEKKSKDLYENVKSYLSELNQGNPVIIFVDELDRCKPTYAVKLLERIKHYFNCPNVIFVFSLNEAELIHTIQNMYGSGFDAGGYLNRFFEVPIQLPPPKLDVVLFKHVMPNHTYFEETVRNTITKLNMQLREIAHYVAMIDLLRSRVIDKASKVYVGDSKAYLFCLNIMIPIMIGIKVALPSKYPSFTNGQEEELFISLIDGMQMRNMWPYLSDTEITDETVIKQRLKRQYRILFANSLPGAGNEMAEHINVNQTLKQILFKSTSLLSEFSAF